MIQTIEIRENITSLDDLKQRFNLQQTEDNNFFPEWYEDLPKLTEEEDLFLEKLRTRYLYHRQTGLLLEGTVNLLVISPLLQIAGFFYPPFKIKSPKLEELTINDPEEIIRGLIDILVVKDNLWILVIEAKKTSIPVLTALPQILAYMMANCLENRPILGMITNGDEFIFVKLDRQNNPEYDLSEPFLLLPKRNKFKENLFRRNK
jgi:Type I restriction enzyme R protein N terminus (HSDR_N)